MGVCVMRLVWNGIGWVYLELEHYDPDLLVLFGSPHFTSLFALELLVLSDGN